MDRHSLKDNITKLRENLRITVEKCDPPHSPVTLVAVSKTRPAGELREAFEAGVSEFGESYLNEALEKVEALADLPITWHFIGPIQSNKTRPIAAHFDWVHSVDREKIARRLDEQRPEELPPLNICLQVNISGEESKSGVTPGQLPALAAAVAQLPRLRLRGLMAIPARSPDPAVQRRAFARLRELYEALRQQYPQLDTLSMGMSGDYESAILEGSTLVRVGTAIFGRRDG